MSLLRQKKLFKKKILKIIEENNSSELLKLINQFRLSNELEVFRDNFTIFGMTPLCIAIMLERIDLIEILMEVSDLTKIFFPKEWTAKQENNELSNLVNSYKEFSKHNSLSILEIIAIYEKVDVLKYLIQNKLIDVTQENYYTQHDQSLINKTLQRFLSKGNIASFALEQKSFEVAEILIQKGVKISIESINHLLNDSQTKEDIIIFLDRLGFLKLETLKKIAFIAYRLSFKSEKDDLYSIHYHNLGEEIFLDIDLKIVEIFIRNGVIFDLNKIIKNIILGHPKDQVAAFEFFKKRGAVITGNDFETYFSNTRPQYINNKSIDFFLKSGLNPANIYRNGLALSTRYPSYFTFERIIKIFEESLKELDVEAIINLLHAFADILLPLFDKELLEAIKLIEDINVQNKDGKTLMHLAVSLKRSDIAEASSSKRASYDIKDKDGNTVRKIIKSDHALNKNFSMASNKAFKANENSIRKFMDIIDIHKTLQYPSSLLANVASFLSDDDLKVAHVAPEERNDLVVHDVAHDGNCFFHVIAANTGLTHQEIRAGAVQHILDHIENFEGFTGEAGINYYIDSMSEVNTWADHLIIQAVANHFGLRIEVLNAEDHAVMHQITPVFGSITQTIVAMYTGNHYYAGYRIANSDELTNIEIDIPAMQEAEHVFTTPEKLAKNSTNDENQDGNYLTPVILFGLENDMEYSA